MERSTFAKHDVFRIGVFGKIYYFYALQKMVPAIFLCVSTYISLHIYVTIIFSLGHRSTFTLEKKSELILIIFIDTCLACTFTWLYMHTLLHSHPHFLTIFARSSRDSKRNN